MARPNNPAHGERIGVSRLTAQTVEEIRRNIDRMTIKQLAARYNVHHRTIEKCRYYETWTHLP